MSEMFCFQCEQTVGGKGCTKVGVCGKTAVGANKQDALTCALVGLARAVSAGQPSKRAVELMIEGLFATPSPMSTSTPTG